MTTTDARERLDLLQLPIEISPEDQQEINQLQQYLKKHSHGATDDANDTDKEGEASRLAMVASDLYKEERKRNERQAAIAERNYAKRKKEMNSWGFRPTS